MKTSLWHRLRVLWHVLRAWNRYPMLRLGQLIENHCPKEKHGTVPVYYVRDEWLVEECIEPSRSAMAGARRAP